MSGKKGMNAKLITSPARIEEMRAKIQGTLIIKKIQDHLLNNTEMSQTQMRAAEILLRKCIPDLAAITHSGDPENPLQHVITEITRKIVK